MTPRENVPFCLAEAAPFIKMETLQGHLQKEIFSLRYLSGKPVCAHYTIKDLKILLKPTLAGTYNLLQIICNRSDKNS